MAFLTLYVLLMIFFCDLAESSAVLLDQAVTCELQYWSKKCPDGVPDFADRLTRAECPRFDNARFFAHFRIPGLT